MRGKRTAAAAGRPAGRPPYGYRRQINPTTGKTDGWVIDENDGPIVAEVIRRTLAGESLWAIVRDLEARGMPAPQVQKNSVKAWQTAAAAGDHLLTHLRRSAHPSGRGDRRGRLARDDQRRGARAAAGHLRRPGETHDDTPRFGAAPSAHGYRPVRCLRRGDAVVRPALDQDAGLPVLGRLVRAPTSRPGRRAGDRDRHRAAEPTRRRGAVRPGGQPRVPQAAGPGAELHKRLAGSSTRPPPGDHRAPRWRRSRRSCCRRSRPPRQRHAPASPHPWSPRWPVPTRASGGRRSPSRTAAPWWPRWSR